MHIRYRHALKKHLFNKHKDKTEEWNSTEALMKMQIQRDPGTLSIYLVQQHWFYSGTNTLISF